MKKLSLYIFLIFYGFNICYAEEPTLTDKKSLDINFECVPDTIALKNDWSKIGYKFGFSKIENNTTQNKLFFSRWSPKFNKYEMVDALVVNVAPNDAEKEIMRRKYIWWSNSSERNTVFLFQLAEIKSDNSFFLDFRGAKIRDTEKAELTKLNKKRINEQHNTETFVKLTTALTKFRADLFKISSAKNGIEKKILLMCRTY